MDRNKFVLLVGQTFGITGGGDAQAFEELTVMIDLTVPDRTLFQLHIR